MRPLKFNVIKREKIDSLLRELMTPADFSMLSNYVAGYERDRPDSLKNIDIFCEGERSIFFRQKGGKGVGQIFFCEKFPKFTGFFLQS